MKAIAAPGALARTNAIERPSGDHDGIESNDARPLIRPPGKLSIGPFVSLRAPVPFERAV
jgi:hypothetical protein